MEVLRSSGFPTLDWDANVRDEDLLAVSKLGAARDEIPRSLGLKGDSLDPFNPTHLNLRLFDGERWIQRGPPAAALAVHLLDIPEDEGQGTIGPQHLVAEIEGQRNVLVVVRPLQLLLAQYELDEQSRRTLVAAATDGVITAVRRTVIFQDRKVALLAVISSVSELERLQTVGTDGVVSSVSLACVGEPSWRDYWLGSLHATSDIVLSCDIPLSQWLEICEAEITPAALRFECQEAKTENTVTPTQFLAIEYNESNKVDTRQLIMGSPTAISSLASALKQSIHVRAAHDAVMVPTSKTWRQVIARLLEEEPWFDRRGVDYVAGEQDSHDLG